MRSSSRPMRRLPRPLIALACAGLALFACAKDEPAPVAARPGGNMADRCKGAGQTIDAEDQEAPEVSCSGHEDGVFCLGEWAVQCQDGELESIATCAATDEVCVDHGCRGDECRGCRVCRRDD